MTGVRWHADVLAPEARQAITALSDLPSMGEFYLAGGTALALQFGHRPSVDLDFFTPADRLSAGKRPAFLAQLTSQGKFLTREQSDGTVHGRCRETDVSFLSYPYPLLDETLFWEGLRIAGPRDIGLMKINAIIGRGKLTLQKRGSKRLI